VKKLRFLLAIDALNSSKISKSAY